MTNPSELHRQAASEPAFARQPEHLPSTSLRATASVADSDGASAIGQARDQACAENAHLQVAVGVGKDFKSRFCRHFGCAEEKFERELFWRTMPPLSRFPAWLVLRLAPNYYKREFRFLIKLGKVRGFDELRLNANSAHWLPSMRTGVMRRWLRMRISGRRLLNVGADVLLD